MPEVSSETFRKIKSTLASLRADRLPWWEHWREVADYILPRRYIWLLSDKEMRSRVKSKNPYILDGTGTQAARTLASGMLNGITSPTRPWFRLRISGFDDERHRDVRIWLDEVTARLLTLMAETNFYNAMAVTYLDLVVFGTGSMLIYEDFQNVFRCYNSALGEYYLAQDNRLLVNTFAREIVMKVHQIESQWGVKDASLRVQSAAQERGGRLQEDVHIVHLIEPNDPKDRLVAKRYPFREVYYERGQEGEATGNKVLSAKGFNELPGVFPRWELVGNDSYGSSPGMDALPDIIQLQHETKKKAQGLDKLISPPVIADVQLRHKPTAFLPNGVTFAGGMTAGSVGAKPVYTVNPPIQAMTEDLNDIRIRVRETFHNDLFRMISQLDTVRSATEIDARREEKLVLLGPVLERFENEALDPAIRRIFNITNRAGLLPPPPAQIENKDIEIQYVSVLSTAQRAVGVVPMERWIQLVGAIAPIKPEVLNVPDWGELVREYGRQIGVMESLIRESVDSAEETDQQRERQALDQDVNTAKVGADAVSAIAKAAPEQFVGGGANALSRVAGGLIPR